jgi:hypothetical protein
MKKLLRWMAGVLATYLLCALGLMVMTGCESSTIDSGNATGTISGKVNRDPASTGSAVMQISTRPTTTSVHTDANGSFMIKDIPAGTYEVVAVGGSDHGSVFVTVVAGRETRADISVVRHNEFAAKVIGYIREEKSNEPLEGVTVSIVGSSNATMTDPHGRYVLYNVVPGTVVVMAVHPGIGSVSKMLACESGTSTTCDFTFRAHPEPLVTDGLVAYYPLDRDANDYGPNRFNGSLFGDVSFSKNTDPINFGAAYFDGKGDRIEIPHKESFNTPVMSVAFWIKPESGSHPNALLIGKSIDGSGDGYMVSRSIGRLTAGSFRNNYSQYARADMSYTGEERWTHVICIFNANRIEIYVNGIQTAFNNWNASPAAMKTTAPFTIGGALSTTVPAEFVQGMQGWLDEVYVFDRILTRNEILTLAKP